MAGIEDSVNAPQSELKRQWDDVGAETADSNPVAKSLRTDDPDLPNAHGENKMETGIAAYGCAEAITESETALHGWLAVSLSHKLGVSAITVTMLEDFTVDVLSLSQLPQVDGKPLMFVTEHVLHTDGLFNMVKDSIAEADDQTLFRKKLYTFFDKVECSYQSNHYHNKEHAADVMLTMHWLCNTPFFQERFSFIDHFTCLIAAAVHDMAHPGTTNAFQVNTRSELFLKYGDKAVLEHMHAALALELMERDQECNWFDLVRTAIINGMWEVANTKQSLKKCIVEMVLATDMAVHKKQIQTMQAALSNAEPNLVKIEEKLPLMSCLLHAADISNPAKSTPVAVKWTQRVLYEFWAQGDIERVHPSYVSQGLQLSPLCDRDVADVPGGQLGFINFIVDPYWSLLAKLIPECKEAVDNVKENRAFWEAQTGCHALAKPKFGA